MDFNAKQIDLRDYLRVVQKHRWTIATVFCVIFVSVLLFTFTATPIYQATTRLIIEKENPKVVSFQEVMSVDSSGLDYYQTQYKIIESRAVAREVIKRTGLDRVAEFNPEPEGGVFRDVLQAVTGFFAWVGSFLRTDEAETAGRIGEAESERDAPLVNAVVQRIEVTPIRNSRLVDVSFESRDPALAARAANAVARSYIDLTLETKLKATQDAMTWLTSRIEEERRKVDAAEKALLQYKERYGIITDFTDSSEKITAQKLEAINQQVIQAEAQRIEAETRYRQAAAMEKNPDLLDSIPEVMANEVVRKIKEMEVEVIRKRSELSKKYGGNHPQIIALQNEIDTLRRQKNHEIQGVIASLHTNYRTALAREQSLRASLNRQKGESMALNQKAVEYTILKRDAERTKEMYDLLVKRFKETTVTEDIRTGNIRVVDAAEVPRFPVKPKKTQNILLAVVVGLALGVGLAFFLEYLDNTIKIPDEIRDVLKIPYLGPVPAMAASGKGNPGPEGQRDEDLVTHLTPKSTASEAYRGIRTGILFSSADEPPQVVLVASSGPREGKTITSANIAIAMAQAGGRVLLMDCDLRRPKLHRLFSLERDRGMANLLVGRAGLDDVVIPSAVPNVDLIPSGPIPPNPSELLSSHHMKSLLDEARSRYERIIIDSPPITAVTDAVILSQMVDGVVLVVRAGETHREVIKNGIGQLRAVNARILGAILNGVDMGRDSYYYYQYYYYYYGEDGERRKKIRRKRRTGDRRGEEERAQA